MSSTSFSRRQIRNLTDNGALSGLTAGTVTASKAVVVDSSKNIAGFNILSAATLNATTINAGADASAGTLVSFPSTTASGKLIVAAVNSSGAFNTTISNASMGQSTVVSIPDPGSATANFVISKGAQSISGALTLTGGLTITTSDVTITDRNIALSDTTGTKIGTATTQKLGFYGATPITCAVLATGAAHTVDDVITALQNLGLVKQS